MAGGVFAGVAGPTLSTGSQDLLLPVCYGGIFVVRAATQVLMLAALAFTDIPAPSRQETHGHTRPLREIARQPLCIVALLSAMFGYGIMNFVMLSTPLVMDDHPLHTIADSNDVIMWHVLGMFAPSFATGWLIKKYGDLTVILAGALDSLTCVVINLSEIGNASCRKECVGRCRSRWAQ